MAVIFGKTTNEPATRKAVASIGREVIDYTFELEPWNIIKVGFFYGFVNPSSPSDAGSAADLAIANLRDNAMIGLRRYDVSKFPLENNTPFVGWKTTSASTQNQMFNSGSPFFSWTHQILNTRYGVFHPNGIVEGEAESTQNSGTAFSTNCNEGATSLFARFQCMYFEVINKGQPNQQILLKKGAGANAVTVTTQAALQTAMNSVSYSYSDTLNFNASGVPYDLPNSMFFYLPWTTVGNCIHNICVQKIS